MRHCPYCKQMVRPIRKKFSWLVFILLLGVFYLPYHLLKPKNRCPMCGLKVVRHAPREMAASN